MQSTEFIHGVTAVAIKRFEQTGSQGVDVIIKGEGGTEKVITLFSHDNEPLMIEEADQIINQPYHENELPKAGERCRHHNGNVYTVLMIANGYSTRPEYPATVVYRGGNGRIWTKPLDDFLAKMTRIGAEVEQ